MTTITKSVADNELALSVVLPAPAERVFRALSTREITDWWVRPGVFDTREWTGDLRSGSRWRAAGTSRGQPYVATGEILEVDPPRRLVHSWDGVGAPNEPSILTYVLEPLASGTRLHLRQSGFASPIACREFATGWETSFARLAEILEQERATVTV
jgi:uncharacterized protein YndB with AHSA1/START domain